MGSFYNHFATKEELFDAAVADAVESFGATMDQLTVGIDDPAHVFAQSFRLFCRLHRRWPELSKVPAAQPSDPGRLQRGLAPAPAATSQPPPTPGGSPSTPNSLWQSWPGPRCAWASWSTTTPERDDAEATDQVTEDLLRMLGVAADEAHDISRRPLPEPDDLPHRDSAA
jgi:AcrR family transcriptional regulator